MTRAGVTIVLVGVLIVGLGGAGYLLPFVGAPIDPELFDTVVLCCWGVGGALVLVGAVTAAVGSAVRQSSTPQGR